MYDITGHSVASNRRSAIEKACARIRHNKEDLGRAIGVIISQITHYLKVATPDVASTYLNQEIKKYPNLVSFIVYDLEVK